MSTRLTTALLALLTFAAAMVIVPLASPDDAGAHPRTTTVQRCSYDPFAGQQCWTENVNASHVHRCGAGLTGTYPNCYPIPPANQPVCPAGMTGTPPNCHPPPPANTQPPPPTTAAPPTTTIYVPVCIPPRHRHGSTCHDNHGDPPCGTGLWTPHVGHYPQQQPPCPTEPRQIRPPRTCETEQHEHAITRSGADSGCHHVSASHCPDGHHQHKHGSGACHNNVGDGLSSSVRSNLHSGSSLHCPDGHHEHDGHYEHKHGSEACHHADTIHCPAGQHAHPESINGAVLYERCHAALPEDHHCIDDSGSNTGTHKHDGFSCHPAGIDNCPDGEHEHTAYRVFRHVKGCHDLAAQHNTGDLSRTAEYVHTATGKVLCTVAGGAGGKAAKLVLKGASWVTKLVGVTSANIGATVSCQTLYDKLIKEDHRGSEADKKDAHNDHADDKRDQDADDQDADDQDADDENSTGSYCGPWTSFAFLGRPDRGGVTLFVNGAPYSQYQSSYDNREWAVTQCQAALAGLGQ